MLLPGCLVCIWLAPPNLLCWQTRNPIAAGEQAQTSGKYKTLTLTVATPWAVGVEPPRINRSRPRLILLAVIFVGFA